MTTLWENWLLKSLWRLFLTENKSEVAKVKFLTLSVSRRQGPNSNVSTLLFSTVTNAQRAIIKSQNTVQNDAQPDPKPSSKAAHLNQPQGSGGVATSQTVPKQVFVGQGARPKEPNPKNHRNESRTNAAMMKRSVSYPELRGKIGEREERKFRFTWKTTSEESLDTKSGIGQLSTLYYAVYD